jgi:hypothetical protein
MTAENFGEDMRVLLKSFMCFCNFARKQHSYLEETPGLSHQSLSRDAVKYVCMKPTPAIPPFGGKC